MSVLEDAGKMTARLEAAGEPAEFLSAALAAFALILEASQASEARGTGLFASLAFAAAAAADGQLAIWSAPSLPPEPGPQTSHQDRAAADPADLAGADPGDVANDLVGPAGTGPAGTGLAESAAGDVADGLVGLAAVLAGHLARAAGRLPDQGDREACEEAAAAAARIRELLARDG